MKKTFLSFLLLMPVLLVQAQSVLLPNGDFENWTTVSYNELQPWFTSNEYTIPDYGFANVNRVTGTSSMYGVRLETKVSGTDTVAAFISNSEDDILNGEGGVPFTTKAQLFSGDYKYNIMTGDTAWIIVVFKKNGNVISKNLYPIFGSKSTYTAFTLPVATMTVVPDSIIIAAISSNINANAVLGSWLELDNLSFTDAIVNVPAPDGDFENWQAKNYDDAQDWFSGGYGEVSKTTDKYTGSTALKLVSKDDGTGYIDEASFILGMPSQSPGMPFTNKVDTLTGYYKYSSSGSDNALLVVMLTTATGMPIGTPIFHQLPTAAGYTYFEVPFSAPVTPDRFTVQIMSSDYTGTPVDGSTLIIDNLRFKNPSVGVGKTSNNNTAITVYPNPAQDVLYISTGSSKASVKVNITDMAGRVISKNEYAHQNGIIPILLTQMVPGMYQYEIQSGDVTTRGKFVKN